MARVRITLMMCAAGGVGKIMCTFDVDAAHFDLFDQRLSSVVFEREDGGRKVYKLVAVDPRDTDPSREGVFRDHNCYRCRDGELPCVRGNPRECDTLHARND